MKLISPFLRCLGKWENSPQVDNRYCMDRNCLKRISTDEIDFGKESELTLYPPISIGVDICRSIVET